MSNYEKQKHEEIIKILLEDSYFGNFTNIFFHNLLASLLKITTGILFGIAPILTSIFQAWSESEYVIFFIREYGTKYSMVTNLHSFVEIPASILSSSLGVSIFLSVFKSKTKIKHAIDNYKESLIVFFVLIIPMLFVAAIIESILIVQFVFR